jgi:hypothetical protein
MTAADPSPTDESIARLSPDALVAPFAGSRLSGWLVVALAAHAVVIGLFSLGTIRDLLDPEGAAARKAAAATPAATAAPVSPSEAAAVPADAGGPAAPAPAEETPAAAPGTPAAVERGTTPIERATTEAAKPGEIPQQPDDLGLSIEDTNPR